jgi:hypothetical protein
MNIFWGTDMKQELTAIHKLMEDTMADIGRLSNLNDNMAPEEISRELFRVIGSAVANNTSAIKALTAALLAQQEK